MALKVCRSKTCNDCVYFKIEIRKISCSRPRSEDNAEFGHFTLENNFQRTAKKCTKIYNALAQLLFCSLNLLFADVLVPAVVVDCLSSLLLCLLVVVTSRLWNCDQQYECDIVTVTFQMRPYGCDILAPMTTF